MQRDAALSKFLTSVMIPLCIWGLISTLVLYLIEVRSAFVLGGESKLRLAALAFAAAVILIQRLIVESGRTDAKPFALAVLVSITAFAFHHAYNNQVPLHWLLVGLISEALFLIMWWAGHRITEACSADDAQKVEAAGDAGILPRAGKFFGRNSGKPTEAEEQERADSARKLKQPDPYDFEAKDAADAGGDEADLPKWDEKLSAIHPGRVIVYFSLVAIPAFGLGIYILGEVPGGRLRLGMYLFFYLWCALALLGLASLGQLRKYFETREVSLPEQIGVTWLGIAFALVTIVVILGFVLPQPPSVSGLFVRERIQVAYRGWENEYGMKDSAGSSKKGGGKQGDGSAGEEAPRPSKVEERRQQVTDRIREVDRLGDETASKVVRKAQSEHAELLEIESEIKEGAKWIFDILIKATILLAAIGLVITFYALGLSFYRGMSEGVGGLLWRKRKLKRPKRPKRKPTEPELEAFAFGQFGNPFLGSYSISDGNELVRYIWRATVAWCSDSGAPCPDEMTPREFVESRPEPLDGFEEQARFIADLFTFSEFSNEPVPESELASLKDYWRALERHAASAV